MWVLRLRQCGARLCHSPPLHTASPCASIASCLHARSQPQCSSLPNCTTDAGPSSSSTAAAAVAAPNHASHRIRAPCHHLGAPSQPSCTSHDPPRLGRLLMQENTASRQQHCTDQAPPGTSIASQWHARAPGSTALPSCAFSSQERAQGLNNSQRRSWDSLSHARQLSTTCSAYTPTSSSSGPADVSAQSRQDSGLPSTSQAQPQGSGAVPARPQAAADAAERSERMLMREFIHYSLYHPTRGYFNRKEPPVGKLPEPINYRKVVNKHEYDHVLAQKYRELGSAFLTPVEIFSPWYGYILARHIQEHRKHNLGQEHQPLDIIEVGGGQGTLARDILNWYRDNAPDDYARMSYTCIEISSRLAAQQYDAVVNKAGHTGRFRVLQADASTPEAWGPGTDHIHAFILMMEVLDNLPHDKVHRPHENSEWMQCVVTLDRNGQKTGRKPTTVGNMAEGPWAETWEPVQDDLILRTLPHLYRKPTLDDALDVHLNRVLDWLLAQQLGPNYQGQGETLWLPTRCLALFDVVHRAKPNHSLIMADFDFLRDIRIQGRNAPLVSDKIDGKNTDYDTVLVPWGTADIFFPTDFDALCRLYHHSAEYVWRGAPPHTAGHIAYAHYRQGEVMRRYREMEKAATLLAFNPLVHDFANARFFLGDSYGRLPATAVTSNLQTTIADAMDDSDALDDEPVLAYAATAYAPSGQQQGQQQTVATQQGHAQAQTQTQVQQQARAHQPGQSLGDSLQQQQDEASLQPVPPLQFSWQWGYGGNVRNQSLAPQPKKRPSAARNAQQRPPAQGRDTPPQARAGGGSVGGPRQGGAGSVGAAKPWGGSLGGARRQPSPASQQSTPAAHVGQAPAAAAAVAIDGVGTGASDASSIGVSSEARASQRTQARQTQEAEEPVLGGRHVRSSTAGTKGSSARK